MSFPPVLRRQGTPQNIETAGHDPPRNCSRDLGKLAPVSLNEEGQQRG